jgi:hypothetical protein
MLGGNPTNKATLPTRLRAHKPSPRISRCYGRSIVESDGLGKRFIIVLALVLEMVAPVRHDMSSGRGKRGDASFSYFPLEARPVEHEHEHD